MDYESLAKKMHDRLKSTMEWEKCSQFWRDNMTEAARMAYDAGVASCKARENAVFDQGYAHGLQHARQATVAELGSQPLTALERSLMGKLFCEKHKVQRTVSPCVWCEGTMEAWSEYVCPDHGNTRPCTTCYLNNHRKP